jgi:uncharacterized protein DUF3891
MISPHPDGNVAVGQQAHAWLSGQLARAWGNDRFGHVEPCEEVCLAAEQHDIGMAAWDRAPTLDCETGLPTSFMGIGVETHLRLWTEGPELLLSQSRYAALLASMHGSALYAQRDVSYLTPTEREQIESFRERRRAFEGRLRDDLAISDAEIARNQRLVWTWDGLSLALILGWAPWGARAVPTAAADPLDLSLRAHADHHTLAPWPFRESALRVRTEGRLLQRRFEDERELHQALDRAPWVELVFELRSG